MIIADMTSDFQAAWHSVHAAARASAWSRDEVEGFQNRRLRELVRRAFEHVTYYHDLYARHGLNPEDVRGIEDLERIPVARRAEMQERPASELVARGQDPRRLVSHRTSGSTGYPFRTYRTLFEERLLQGLRLKREFKLGLRLTDVRVAIVLPGHGSRGARPDTHFYNHLGLLRRPIVDCLLPAAEILERTAELRPDVMMGYPDTLDWIAGEATAEQRRRIRPRMILTGGETLTLDMRRRIADCFHALVYDFYGLHEFNLLASECPQTGLYHVAEDSAIVEVLKDGRPAARGEAGEVVATALHSRAMPLIRYSTGDFATRGPLRCPCGASGTTLESIQGRVVDRFVLPDGTRLHPYELLEAFIDEAVWLRRYQMVQESVDRIVVKIVPFAGCDPSADNLQRLQARFQQSLGPGVYVVFEKVNELPPAGNGKFRPYYSLVRDSGATRRPA
jgi:phenylacetate-CoA ligase